jgi:hypothetical protein
MSSLVEFCCYNYLYCKNGAILLYEYFLTEKDLHRRFKRLVMSRTHHQRFVNRRLAVMAPSNSVDLNPTPPPSPHTGGDSLFEPAVMGYAGVVFLRFYRQI